MIRPLKTFNIAACVAMLLTACNQSAPRYEPIPDCQAQTISAIELDDTTEIGMVRSILTTDSFIVILDQLQPEKIHLFDRQTGAHVGSSLRIGQGHDEIVYPGTFSSDARSGLLAVYDPVGGALMTCEPSSAMLHEQAAWRRLPLPDYESHPKDAFIAADSTVIALHGRSRITKSQGKTIKATYDEYPVLPDELESPQMFFLAQTLTAVSPDGSRIAQGTAIGCILETLQADGSVIKQRALKCFERPVYSVVKGQIDPQPETVYGFADLHADDEYIYATIHGVANPTVFPNTIYIFDWKGEPVKKYVSDRQIVCFNVDRAVGRIYAIVLGADGEQHLAMFDIA